MFLAILVVLSMLQAVSAQQPITINRNDMPNINGTYRFSLADNLLGIIDLDDTGENMAWDYATLPSLSQRVVEWVDPVFGTPLAYNVTFSNLLLLDHFATIATENPFASQFFGFGPVQFEEVFDFYRETNGFLANVGMGATINGIPLTSIMQPRDFVYRFPMTYGSEDQSFSQFGFDVPTFGHYGQKLLRTNTVDGWGTLTTRYGTFEVIRVFTELQRTDTISIQGFGFEQDRPTEFEVKWLGKNHGLPLLTVSGQYLFGSMVVNEVIYMDSLRDFTPPGPFFEDEGEEEVEEEEQEEEEEEEVEEEEQPQSIDEQRLWGAVAVYPNPTAGDVVIAISLDRATILSVSVTDIIGREVIPASSHALTTGTHAIELSLSALPHGTYMLRLSSPDGASHVTRLLKNDR